MNCSYCGDIYQQKSARHKYCKSSCRQKAHRERNGIPAPTFMQGYEKKKILSKPKIIATHQMQISGGDYQLNHLNDSINYYEHILQDAKNNTFPMMGITTGVVGAMGGAMQSKEASIGFGILFGLIGHHVDKKRKDDLIRDCMIKIRELKKEKSNLMLYRRVAQTLTAKKKVNYNGLNYKPSIMTVSDYKELEIPTIGFDSNSQWSYLFGDPQENFSMMLYGAAGNGKSSFALQLADYFDKHFGKVLFVASEQHGTNKALQNNLKRNTRSDANIQILMDKDKQTFEELERTVKAYRLVILDSVDSLKLNPDNLEHLRKISPRTAFISVHQCTKEGNFRGSQEWAHNSDIVIKMDNFKAIQTKSRFAVPSSIVIK